MPRIVLIGLIDHLAPRAKPMTRIVSKRIEPRGGVLTYIFLPKRSTTGTAMKIPVGTRYAIQYPWSRARKEAEMAPQDPKLIAA